MKTKEIIITTETGDRMEDQRKNDLEMTTATLVISSVKYAEDEDDDDNDNVIVSKLKRAGKRLSAGAIYYKTNSNSHNNNNNNNDDANIDIVYHRNNKNNKYNAATFNDDYRYFGRTTSMIDHAGFLISDKHYCNCGKGVGVGVGAGNKKSSSPSVKNTKNTIYHREIDSIILDANKNCVAAAAAAAAAATAAAAAATATVYATKKTLMLNEFLELNAEKERSPSSVQRYDVTRTTFVNRFVSEANGGGKCVVKSASNCSATSAFVVEKNGNNNSSGGWSSSSIVDNSASVVDSCGSGGKGCNVINHQNQSLCLNSSVLLTDKRLVGLFRSVALYWFFCLNTVLAKGDHVFKRKLTAGSVSPLMNDGLNEQLLLQHTSCSLTSSQGDLQLQICCPDVVLAVFGVDQLNNDHFLWTTEASAPDENDSGGGLLSWADHSKTKLFNDLFEKVLRNLADNCGIFTTIAANPSIVETSTSSKHRFRHKIEHASCKKMGNRNCEAVVDQRDLLLLPTPPSSTSPSKPTKKSAKKVIGVRRKCIIDMLDYYYDDDQDHDDVEQEEEYADKIYTKGKSQSRTRRATRRTPNTTVVNRIIWKKRAVKNKQKSKRKMAASIAAGDQHRRLQQIIIECYEAGSVADISGAAFRTDYVINDGYEEVVGASEIEIGSPPPTAAIVEDDDIIDFDNYAENLKREVTLRQQRKRRQLSSSYRQQTAQAAPVPAIKIIEPTMSSKSGVFESTTEDELSGTGSTNSSLLLELEREVRADRSSYFLPDGRYHSVNQKYPKYDLWCSPLLMEKVLPSAPETAPVRTSLSSRNQTANTGGSETGRIFKYAKPAATAPPPAAASFKPYRLWESSFGPEDDLIPSFGAGQRVHRKTTAAGTAKAKITPSGRRPPFTAAKESSAAAHHQSTYTLWGSPKIIDFLPGVGPSSGSGCSSSSGGSVHPNEGSCSSSRGTMSSSSISEAESSSMECDEYASDTFEVLRTTAGHKRDEFNYHNQYQHQFSVRGGKFLNLKPIINGFVSFTDRGAFQYYKKPATPGTRATSAMIALALRSTSTGSSSSSRQSDGSRSVSDASTTTDAADVEVSNIVPRSDYETQFHFKPIQPAFKVPTDTPPLIERSASGTLWCNSQRLMVFKHELDDVSMQQQPPQQRPQPRSRAFVHELDSFQPKFVVNPNDVACQTEWIELNPFERVPSMDGAASFFAASSANEKKTSHDPSYASGAMFFYAWDEVFNFLNKPGIGNIDVKAHLDLSCFF